MASATVDDRVPAFSRAETLTGVVVVGVLAMLLGAFGLLQPAQTIDARSVKYRHLGSFNYSAEPRKNSPYGPGGVATGDPIFVEAVGPVSTTFSYELESRAAAEVKGSATLLAEVELPQGLTREFVLSDPEAFTGSKVSISASLPLREINRFVERARLSIGSVGFNSATVTIRPVVKVSGSLAGHELNDDFSPQLTMTLEGTVLTVPQSSETIVTGDNPVDPLKPSERDRIEYETRVDNTVPLLIAEPTVPVARGIGFGIAGACLVAGLWIARPLMRTGDPANESARFRTLYGAHLIEVSELSLQGGPVAQVGSMDALVELAKKYELKIMHVTGPGGNSYSVWDNGLLYEYRPSGATAMDEVHGRHADLPTVNGSGSNPMANGKKKSPHKART